MNETIGAGRRRRLAMPPKPAHAAVVVPGESRVHSGAAEPTGVLPASLPTDALDDRIAIVGTAGSGKTYAAKGFVERLLDIGARVAIVDPLGVWWGLRASADGSTAGYPVVVFGGRHADVPITAEKGSALGRMIACEALACVVDLSELGSNAARRRFMAAFSEALYEENEEPLHLVLDEADLWAPQRPIKGWEGLLGHIEEIVRRGRVRGFIPWLITQRPAVVHKDVLSQADILIAMKLTASQDRDAIGAWIEGQADRQEGKRILGDLPRLQRGEGYLWAPGHGILDRATFPLIRTFDSSRTPKRGERLASPRTLAEVDLTAIIAALAAVESEDPEKPKDNRRQVQLERELAQAKARIELLEQENRALNSRLVSIAAFAAGTVPAIVDDASHTAPRPKAEAKPPRPLRIVTSNVPATFGDSLHPAARKLLLALAQHAPARFTWGQAATLAGLKPSGGHFNAGRKSLRESGYIEETNDLLSATASGLKAAGEVPPAPSTPAERLALWCDRLPTPAPEMLRTLAAQGERYMEADELAAMLGKKSSGGHWNSGIALLRNNGLIETDGRRYRTATLFRHKIEGSH
jgi:Helicase HerA, central domain